MITYSTDEIEARTSAQSKYSPATNPRHTTENITNNIYTDENLSKCNVLPDPNIKDKYSDVVPSDEENMVVVEYLGREYHLRLNDDAEIII